ncbi:hypothetical protein MLD38_012427 [Melastoma candidum]|uniref:Uncharacterized protein n=1 Tax=Melastoma candidum TaxID=119954 RepID=A0ACB9R7K3_9MYRT|nr:hypothetical protein MLD38_012427 [Melastoma candidum]
MDDTQSVASLMDSTSSKIQQLQKAFAELERHRVVTLNLKWKELEEHFHGLERSLKRRFDELEDQEKVLETKARKAQELLQKREADVAAKERASLERLQKKRDAVVSVISNVLKRQRSVSWDQPAVEDEGQDNEEKTVSGVTTENNSEDTEDLSEVSSAEVTSYPPLHKLCRDMDAEGLHRFISDNRKNLATIREKIPSALNVAPSPAVLVLKSLEGFYGVNPSAVDGKKDANLLGIRRTCIMLMECLMVLLMHDGPDSDMISENVKQQAKQIAKEWKPKLDALDMTASNGNCLEAHAFLQLLATFGIANDFNEEYLLQLVPAVSRRRQTAELCLVLGLSSKMPGVIDALSNSGRQIDAVNLAFAFELTEQFPPVPFLKSYLKEAREVASPVKLGNSPAPAQVHYKVASKTEVVNERELAALKAAIKCIEEHKLEEQFPLDPLHKQLLHLEKAKADKKVPVEVPKPQPKRCRAISGVTAAAKPHHLVNVANNRAIYATAPEGYTPYIYERHYMYPGPIDNRGPATYNLPPPQHPPQSNFLGSAYHYPATYFHRS